MKPRLLIFAGPNGSGKSTLTTPAILERFGISREHYINADEIAKLHEGIPPTQSQEQRERYGFQKARVMRQAYRALGESFAFETVFSHPSTLLDMQLCKAAGFEVVVIFVTTSSPEINVERVAGRYLAGGHDVPVERIRSRYQRTMALLPRILKEANRWFVYDNSGAAPEPITSFDGRDRTDHAVSEFWRAHLIEPLEQRWDDWWELAWLAGTLAPDLATGEYTGEIDTVTPHSILQTVNEHLIWHDRLLLPAELSVGQVVTIKYKDATGEVL